ncbi:MAG: GTP-binding protein, partial [Rubrobacter sp.]|nr:GTP-binding protein [Rubrobacter sp.]
MVTGFLGSGKTTLLARMLSVPFLANTAVLVNEFGEVGLDHHLLRRAEERTILLGNGCVCCTTREDLVGVLLELLDEEGRGEIPALDRIVVETTGLADPAPILFTVFSHPVLQHHYYVDLVICTVDAVNGELHLDLPESTKQVAAADVIVLSKTDVAQPGAADGLRVRLRRINSSAHIIDAPYGKVDPDKLLHPVANWSPTGLRNVESLGVEIEAALAETNSHVSGTYSTSLTFDGLVDWVAFGTWLS